jgi:phosphonate transport system substrate-binding protein
MRFVFASLLTALMLVSCSPKKDSGPTLVMGFTPAESSEKVMSNGKVISDIIEKETGVKVKTFVATDYTALVEAMRSGQVDIAWLAPFAFVLAEKNSGAKVLLKSVRHGQASQYSAIIVKENSPYKKIEDLKGKTIAWTDPSSSSGHIVPKSALIAQGIDPDTFFKKQTWAGSHESLVMAVVNGTVDAGATYTDDPEGKTGSWTKYEQNSGETGGVKLHAIYVTPPMPSDTVAASKKYADEHPEMLKKITQLIQDLSKTAQGREALMNLYSIEALVPAESKEYEPLRMAAAKLGYDLKDSK